MSNFFYNTIKNIIINIDKTCLQIGSWIIKNKKVAVTGGLGFIGSHIIEELCKDNEVVIVDNKATGNIKNIKNFDNEKITVFRESIVSADLNKIFEGCDYVLHQAALPSVPRSVKGSIEIK